MAITDPYPGLPTEKARDLRVGDLFIDRITFRPWRVRRFDDTTGQNPHVEHVVTLERTQFSGAAEPYGPYRDVEEVRRDLETVENRVADKGDATPDLVDRLELRLLESLQAIVDFLDPGENPHL